MSNPVATLLVSICLLVLLFLIGIGNMWFTYGLWPQSWAAYFFFIVAYLMVMGALKSIGRD